MPRRRITREEQQEQTRARLLAAAARVFARRGYDGASIAQIAEEAGYSHGAVYSNFKDKKDLFLALYEGWVAKRVSEIEAARPEAATLAERARSGAEEWMRRVGRDPDAFLLRLEFTAGAARDADLRRKLGTRVGAVPLVIQRLLEDATDAEALENSLPAEELALGLQALSLGLALEALVDSDAVRPGLAGDLAEILVTGVTAGDRSKGS